MSLDKQKVKVTAKQRRAEKSEAQALVGSGKPGTQKKSPTKGGQLEKLMAEYQKTGAPELRTEIFRLKGLLPAQ